jgi:aldehyde dehydrogenase (NAD+)
MIQTILEKLEINDLNIGINSALSKQKDILWHDVLPSFNPATKECIANVRTAGQDALQSVIQQSLTAFQHWRMIPGPKRGECIRLIGEELRKHKDSLGTLISLETGKIKSEGDGEVQEMIDMADFTVGQSRMLYGKTMHSERPHHRMYEQWHPLGPIGIITAFNFPVAVWAWNAFIAAICGNTVIWKPSSKTPLCAIAVQKICERVMQKAGYPNIFSLFVPKDDALVMAFVADQRIPLISFTGSVSIGRKVNAIVTQRLGKTLLELSGNNAIIVDETANLSLALRAIVFGAIGTAGQRCTTTRRLFIHYTQYDELTTQLVRIYKHIRIGDPLDINTMMGPLIDETAINNYLSALDAVQQVGGKIIYGGKLLSKKGYFVEPTLVKAKNHWDIVQQETFAPILYLIPYRHLEQAIYQQNAVPQGLSSALFTQNLLHAEQFLAATGSDCGIANINIGTSGAEIGGAFGGEKETGGGREAGSDSWKAYMRRQTNTINWGDSLPLAQGIQFQID